MAHLALWLVGMTGLIFGARNLQGHIRARRQAEVERERLIAELQEALANVKTLRGLIPICASCKKSAMTKAIGPKLRPISNNTPARSSATAFAWIA